MAEFLRTNEISTKIEDLIENSQDKLVLMSPYLQINKKIKNRLKVKDNRKQPARIVYRKNKLELEENNWLKNLNEIRTSYCEDLHAKCYLNEKEAIITSMNLYQHSQENNYEMGIYVKKDEDPNLYKDIKKQVDFIVETSQNVEISVEKVPEDEEEDKEETGHCIRCKEDIELDPTRPYCSDCFSTWNKYKNGDYEESHCHICGKEMEATRNKPVCYDCYKEHKDELEFPST